MAKKNKTNSNPYAKKRQKVKKPDETIKKASPFKKELDTGRNQKVVIAVVAVIVIVMIGSMIIPYLGGGSSKNYSLPTESLKGNTESEDSAYSSQNIIVGETFNRVDKEYYVLYGNSEETSALGQKILRATFYTADSGQAMNSSLKTDVASGKAMPQKPEEIKIKKDVALIQIKDGKAIKFIDGKNEVSNFLDTLK